MFIVVRGDIVTGFKLFGPFETQTQASDANRNVGNGVVANMSPPSKRDFADTPQMLRTVAEYVDYVKDERITWVVVKGCLEKGFKFRGPLPRRRRRRGGLPDRRLLPLRDAAGR